MTDKKIDITAYNCPMTFVKTRVQLAEMQIGETLEIILNAGEPLSNLPVALWENGHEVLEVNEISDGVYSLICKKGAEE